MGTEVNCLAPLITFDMEPNCCAWVFACMRVCLCARLYVNVCMWDHLCMDVCYACAPVCITVRARVCMRVLKCVSMSVCVCTTKAVFVQIRLCVVCMHSRLGRP